MPSKPVPGSPGAQEGLHPAEAEPDDDDAPRAGASGERLPGRDRVGLHLADARLQHVGQVVEALAAHARARGAAERVQGDRVVPGVREALRQLDVERRQAADVGQDDHARTARTARGGQRGREARAVGRGQLQELGGSAAAQRGEREVGGEVGRAGVGGEAHGRS